MIARELYLGHEDAWRAWHAARQSGRLHHGWLLSGPKGLGKGGFARAAALELIGAGGNANDPDHHPDIIILENLPDSDTEAKKRDEGKPFKTRRNISVDQIRAMQRRLTTRPTLGDRRAVIIDPADNLEKGAVNALLKSLEEPPEGTFFLLVCHQPGRLLPTVRSRCRSLRFSRLDPDALDTVLRREAPDADLPSRQAAIAAAHGSPAAALEFLDEGLGALHTLMQRIIREGDRDFALRGTMASEIGARPDRSRQLAVLDLARATLTEELPSASRERQLRIIEAHGALATLGAQVPTYNYDPGLLVMEIGGLLASAAMPREAANQS
jgi:DNA polymerase-3 subunit delta'